jgi:malate dehydrogenase (oxaloacetate-decarboxylating)
MHDDQHGTAIVVLAGLYNAVKVVKKDLKKLRVVISGAGAAGTATAKLLLAAGVKDIIMLDRHGALYAGRKDGMTVYKKELAQLTNPRKIRGPIDVAMQGADVFIGLSGKGLLHSDHVASMAPRAIVFALANPEPEILPDVAKKAGAFVIATGRSDFPNQINNALVFPGVFRGALDNKVVTITTAMQRKAAVALAGLVAKPTAGKIVPGILDRRIVPTIARVIR